MVRSGRLRAYVEALFRVAGVTRGGARAMADTYLEADLRGISGHGCRLVPGMLTKLEDGRLSARSAFTVVRRDGATLVLDAGYAPGPLAVRAATAGAERLARIHGVGLVAVHRSGHVGAVGIGAARLAERGLIGIVATQTSAPSVALLGGTGAPVLGNSAIAVAIPGPDHPVLVDLAAGPLSWGRLHEHARAGRTLPAGCAVDRCGRPVRDPERAAVLLPSSGRAQALAIVLELLVGAVIGATPLPTGQDGRGLLCLAIDPTRLTTAHQLSAGVEAVARAVHDDGVRMPGDRSWRSRATARTEGIALDHDTFNALVAAGRRLPGSMPPLVPLAHP
ncbi:Ldh family oxidoreductase [Streptomyces sp. SL13]|uniref:Ldh family oxidoreductase n=1 Tax=Streptantibioticus silvisoli TaxID=2705255 RepID=A0AA90KGA2_9ACTN|nr:Ldh family oxidoreductase [Streptantibioticus silvisoli]MDI5969914.1 Ldh family oxidoreductase [Streptantibioticus silvisoli]